MNEFETLYMNARRARDENNNDTAIECYEAILKGDPTSWEASFFVIYLNAVRVELSEKAEAVVDVLNCLGQVLNLD